MSTAKPPLEASRWNHFFGVWKIAPKTTTKTNARNPYTIHRLLARIEIIICNPLNLADWDNTHGRQPSIDGYPLPQVCSFTAVLCLDLIDNPTMSDCENGHLKIKHVHSPHEHFTLSGCSPVTSQNRSFAAFRVLLMRVDSWYLKTLRDKLCGMDKI